MPGATPVFGFRYPFETDAITVTDFANLANDIDAAQTAIAALATAQLTARPLARVQMLAGQNSASGAPFTVLWDTVATRITDNNGMFNTGAPDRFTIQTAGVYMINTHDFFLLGGFATVDQMEAFLLVNGVIIAGERMRCSTSNGPMFFGTMIAWPLNAGDVVQVQASWTGTGGPGNWANQTYFSLSYVCPLV